MASRLTSLLITVLCFTLLLTESTPSFGAESPNDTKTEVQEPAPEPTPEPVPEPAPEPNPELVPAPQPATGAEIEPAWQEPPGYLESLFIWSDRPHQAMSNRLESLSQGIDSFFGEDRIYEEATETYLQIRADLIYERGGHLSLDHRLRLKIDLPQMEKRLKLVFESEGEREDVVENEPESSSLIKELDSQNTDYSAALQFILKESRRWNISLGPGVRLVNPPDLFARLRIRRQQAMGPIWQNRLTERLTEFVDRGLESRTTLELERRTGRGQLFRLTSGALWREEFENDNLELSQSAQLFQRISRRDTFVYETSVIWETKPNLHHETYIADVRWRRRIHKKWLFFEIKPQATFEREHHFRLDPSITFSLEVLFGERYLGPYAEEG